MTKARIRQLRGAAGDNENLTECLNEIERLQRFTRRGLEPNAEPIPPAEKQPSLAISPTVNLKKKARGTVQELQAFAREQKMPASDGEFLFHHFEGKGWKDVKDWRAHFRKWKSANWLPSQKTMNGNRPQRSEPPGVTL